MRIQIAQIYHNLAYFDSNYNYLEEASFLCGADMLPLGSLRKNREIGIFLYNFFEEYKSHINNKVSSVLEFAKIRKTDIVIFPEYSIPLYLIEKIQNFCLQNGIMVIAGSHRVKKDNYSDTTYINLNLKQGPPIPGTAICFICDKSGNLTYIYKTNKSKFETNLLIKNDENLVYFALEDFEIDFLVKICIDAILLESYKTLSKSDRFGILFCPSYSPSSNQFENISRILSLYEVPMVYCNTALFGGSQIYLDKSWQPYLKGASRENIANNSDTEVVIEYDLNPKEFCQKRGSVLNNIPLTHNVFFPIIYRNDSLLWIKYYLELKEMIYSLISKENYEVEELSDFVDDFLSEHINDIPFVLKSNLEYLKYNIFPSFSGNIDLIRNNMEIVFVENEINTKKIWGKWFENAKEVLIDIYKKSDENIENITNCLRCVKLMSKQYPLNAETAISRTEKEYTEEAKISIIEYFQNRGDFLENARNIFSNKENRVIIINGPIGIGKSDFSKWMFMKQFNDWNYKVINIDRDSSAAKLITQIAYEVNIAADINLIASCSNKVFRKIVNMIVKKVFYKENFALIIDDLHSIFVQRNARYNSHLQILFDEICKAEVDNNGKFIFISSMWLPDKWTNHKGVTKINLTKLANKFIKRIIEYQLRKENLYNAASNKMLINQKILNIIDGVPLAAKLIVQIIKNNDEDILSEPGIENLVGKKLAYELIKHIKFTEEEEEMLKQISIFRKPIKISKLMEFIPEKSMGDYKKAIEMLLTRGILFYNGITIDLHEAIKRYFIEIINNDNSQIIYHSVCVNYYISEYNNYKKALIENPDVLSEMVHHMIYSERDDELKDFVSKIAYEIKPNARKIYREEKNYEKALKFFQMVEEVNNNDTEVLAYIGRCYARINLWDDSNAYFRKAINSARSKNEKVHWIYRDWGHILSRYEYYEKAKKLLKRALKYEPNDVSSHAAVAYIEWKTGNTEEAVKYFENALMINRYHPYTLRYYSIMLKQLGNYEYSIELDRQYEKLNDETCFDIDEYELEIDDDI